MGFSTYLVIFCLILILQPGEIHCKDERDMEKIWTGWADWSSCSISCGQGIQTRHRVCAGIDGNRLVRLKNPDCVGQNIEHIVCKIKDCPTDSTELRETLCTVHNTDILPKTGNRYEWIPFYGGANPCELTCMARGYNFFNSFGNVPDGTPCHEDDDDNVCVDGKCRRVDCDGVVGSDRVEDWCKVCGGNNANCTVVRNSFKIKSPKTGKFDYQLIVKVPSGATYLEVEDKSKNFLALADNKGRHLINGRWTIDGPGKYDFAGTTVIYERNGHLETLKAEGPTKEDLYVMLIFRVPNPGINYKFFLSTDKLLDVVYPKARKHQKNIIFGPEKPRGKSNSESQSKSQNTAEIHNGKVNSTTDNNKLNSHDRKQENYILPDKINPNDRHINTNGAGTKNYKIESNKRYNGNHKETSHNINGYHEVRLNQDWVNTSLQKKLSRKKKLKLAQYKYRKLDTYTQNEQSGISIDRNQTGVDQPNHSILSNTHKVLDHKDNTRYLHASAQTQFVSDTKNSYREVQCSSCHGHRLRMDYFCESDFAIHGRIERSVLIGGDIRYEVHIIEVYKEKLTLLSDEYIWITGQCHCPVIYEKQEYIIMGKLLNHLNNRESRLELEKQSYVRPYSQRAAVRLELIGKSCANV